MNVPSLVVAGSLLVLSIAVQFETSTMLLQSNKYRQLVLASTDRCPKIPEDDICQVKIAARRDGLWDVCNDSAAPSGANLPMHRWFRISGQCRIMDHTVNISLPLAPQLVYR